MAEGWATVRFTDVCMINPAKPPADLLPPDAPVTFVPMPAVDADKGSIAVRATRPFAEVRRGFTAFRDGDVIMAKITPCMENGKAAIARDLQNGLGFGSTEFHVFRSNGAVLPEYLFHFIRQESFRKAAEAEMTGSVGQKRVPVSFLEGADLPLPPLAEQKRIVAMVEELLARVNAARERLARVPAILKRFRQSVLAAACSGRLTADWREKHPSIDPASERWSVKADPVDVDGLPELPNNWVYRRLKEIAERVSVGHVGPTSKYYCAASEGIPFVRSQNVRPSRLVLDDAQYITPEFHQTLRKSQLQAGDLLVVRVGANRGDACIVPDGVGPLNCANIVFARPFQGISDYLNIYSQGKVAQDLLLGMTTGSA